MRPIMLGVLSTHLAYARDVRVLTEVCPAGPSPTRPAQALPTPPPRRGWGPADG